MDVKKLHRSRNNKILAGVIGGFGEYFDIDPVVLRVLMIFAAALSGFIPFIIAYLIALLVVPKETP